MYQHGTKTRTTKLSIKMITITIGLNGRFGNQMFQYASLMGIADKQNCLYGIDYSIGNKIPWYDFTDNEIVNKQTFVLPKAFHLSAFYIFAMLHQLDLQYQNFFAQFAQALYKLVIVGHLRVLAFLGVTFVNIGVLIRN